ncbi:MAG TPA: acetyl-CoA carboxylase biotin carboxyl carrier protein [Gemmatimonadaceae bacterium]|nr:acetyl-CoA carboxylase biotin carboxyl carrier protein [Gemmatimonadaceae bacterium]
MIDLRYVKKLIEMLDNSTVDSVEISTDKGMKIRLSKTPQGRGAGSMTATLPVATMTPTTPVPRLTPTEAMPAVTEPEPPRAEPPKPNLLEVKSPMVGTFYAQPEPGAKPYVTVGTRIAKKQVLCIIEAMKIMNEIESEFAGVVKEVCVQDSHPVEYGQVLFRVDPNG